MRRPLTAFLAALVVFVAACGEKDEVDTTAPVVPAEATTTTEEPSAEDDEPARGESDEESIADVLSIVLTTADPELACGEAVTSAYIRNSYGDQRGCELAQSEKSAAEELGVREVIVRGGEASAAVRVTGGVYDGQKLEASLVLDGKAWRLDALTSDVPVGP